MSCPTLQKIRSLLAKELIHNPYFNIQEELVQETRSTTQNSVRRLVTKPDFSGRWNGTAWNKTQQNNQKLRRLVKKPDEDLLELIARVIDPCAVRGTFWHPHIGHPIHRLISRFSKSGFFWYFFDFSRTPEEKL